MTGGRYLLAACVLVFGCARSTTGPNGPATGGVPYRLGDTDGHLSMTLGQVTLVFEGLPADLNATGTSGSFFVPPASGSGGGSVDVGSISIKHKEADGVCTVNVNGAVTFRLTEGGAKLVLGNQAYIIDAVQIIRVAPDGTPR